MAALAALLLAGCDRHAQQSSTPNAPAAVATAQPKIPAVAPRTDIKGVEIGMSPSDVHRLHADCHDVHFTDEQQWSTPGLGCPVDNGELLVLFTSAISGARAYSVGYCFSSQLDQDHMVNSVAQQYRLQGSGAPASYGGRLWNLEDDRQLTIESVYHCGYDMHHLNADDGPGPLWELSMVDQQLSDADGEAIQNRIRSDEAARQAAIPPPKL
jgi:hypothetical protein